MKKGIVVLIVIILFGCSPAKTGESNPLYEVMLFKSDGGANIKFYEILSEEKEIKMLLNDPNLKRKIKPEVIQKCNFIILNMGPLPTGNNKIFVDKIEETPTNIILYIKEEIPPFVETDPKLEQVFVYPYSILKINSKKEIVIM